ncbi:hypothetical protein CAL7716_043780 [Calothrix sp. PCC 7716]|nr:hypothetical protein CAL7716_043780 [Calothrix sp. PCC 7716]
MPFWYNTPSEGSEYSNLACTDFANLNSLIKFDEVAFKSDDDFIYVFGYASDASDLIKVGDKDFKFTPQLITFKLAKKNYQKYDVKTKAKVDVEQSMIEKLMCQLLGELDFSDVYTGTMQLQTSNIINMLVTGKQLNGEPLPDVVKESMVSSYLSLKEIDEPKHIKVDALKLPEKKSWGGNGAKAQSELEKINDRLTFICNQLKVDYPSREFKSLSDIIVTLTMEPEAQKILDMATMLFS